MLTRTPQETWSLFLEFIEEKCSATEFENWFASIRLKESSSDEICLEVPNIFVQEYVLDNYKKDLAAFLPTKPSGELAVKFVIADTKKKTHASTPAAPTPSAPVETHPGQPELSLNSQYTFNHFIEGPSNQFVKSAALGVAARPGKSYNPLFIHGGVGLGKTHLLHSIGHYIREHHKKLRIQCITTEAFINDIVDHLRNQIDRQNETVLPNASTFFSSTISSSCKTGLISKKNSATPSNRFINQNKQIVITCDKPPGQLKLSERMVARMEWGLVANMGVPDLETRVAIIKHKSEQQGFRIPQQIAFFIAEHIYQQCPPARRGDQPPLRLLPHDDLDSTEDVVEKTLSELFQMLRKKRSPSKNILKSVATIFEVRISDLKSTSRAKEIAFARQVAMYLAKELINDSLMKLSNAFGGKSHSTLLHAWKKVAGKVEKDETLRRQIDMARRNLES